MPMHEKYNECFIEDHGIFKYLKQGWAHYGPRAGSGPRGFLVRPAEESFIFDWKFDIMELILEVGIIHITYYTEVRWISRGHMLKRFFDLRDKVKLFMEQKESRWPSWMINLF